MESSKKAGGDQAAPATHAHSPARRSTTDFRGVSAPSEILPVSRLYRGYTKSPGNALKFVNRIITNMTGNPNFTGATIDSLVQRLAEIGATLTSAWALSTNNKSSQNQATTLIAVADSITALDNVADYVEANAGGNRDITNSSGFKPYADRRSTIPAPGAPLDVALKIEKGSGIPYLCCTSLGTGVMYLAMASTDNGVTWSQIGSGGDSRKILLRHLKSGTKYLLTIAGETKGGVGPRHEPAVAYIAQ